MAATGYISSPQFSNLLLSLLISRHPPPDWNRHWLADGFVCFCRHWHRLVKITGRIYGRFYTGLLVAKRASPTGEE